MVFLDSSCALTDEAPPPQPRPGYSKSPSASPSWPKRNLWSRFCAREEAHRREDPEEAGPWLCAQAGPQPSAVVGPAKPPLLCRCCRPVPPEKGSLATSPRIPQTVGAQGLEAAREGSVCTMFHCSVSTIHTLWYPPASPREREYHNKGVSFPAGTPEQRNTDPQRASGRTQRAARRPTASRPSMPAACC